MIVQLAHFFIGMLQSFLLILFLGLFANKKDRYVARVVLGVLVQTVVTFFVTSLSSPWLPAL